MEWYYAAGSDRKGPVSAEQMLALIAAGSVKPETLVWNSSLTGWQPASTTVLFAAPPPPLTGAADATQLCIITGKTFSLSQMIQTEHGWVSGEGRDLYYQSLRENAPIPFAAGVCNARADGKCIVVPAKDARLPMRCVKTNGPVTPELVKRRKLWWCPPLVFLALLLNILVVLILYFVFRKPVELEIPLSKAGRKIVHKHVLISFGVLGVGLGLIVAGAVNSNSDLAALIVLGILVVLGGLIYAAIKTPVLRVTKLKNGEAWLSGAAKEYVASLPAYQRR